MSKKTKNETDAFAETSPENAEVPRGRKCGKWGRAFAIVAGALTACSLFTCVPAVYPAFIFIVLFLIPVVCTLGLIFVINRGYWGWISGILSGGMEAAEVMSKVWIWPEIAGALFCIAAIALYSRDKTKKHTAGMIVCGLFAAACVLFAVLRLAGNEN